METMKAYSSSQALTVEAFKNRPSSLPSTDENYVHPTSEDVKSIRNILGLSQVGLAKLLGVTYNEKKGSNTVRKWETSEESKEHRKISYAAWRLLLLASGVITEQDIRSEADMYKIDSTVK